MDPTLLGISIVASFFGGVLALIAPCCVPFVFPAYFASAFKEKSRIILMTLIFFIGMAIVLVPVGLGMVALSRTIARFHDQVFLFGGIFLIILGILSFLGKGLPMPFKIKDPDLKKSDPLSVFLLGVFSGAASSCCTPVLAGVLTITALSGTFIYALILSLTYVFGMVFPLFVMSYFWDKYDFQKAKWLQGKLFEFKILGQKIFVHSSHLIAAIIFTSIGSLIVILTLLGKTTMPAAYQGAISHTLGRYAQNLSSYSLSVPQYIWAGLFLLLIVLIIVKAFQKKGDR